MTSRLTLSLIMAFTINGNPERSGDRNWVPATYHGLIVGKSTHNEVLKQLGQPSSEGKEQDTAAPFLIYHVSDPLPGDLTVFLRHNRLEGLTFNPKSPVTKGEIVRRFGSAYRIVHYDTDDCLTDGGTAPLYESVRGLREQMEYRGLGVAVLLNGPGAQAIIYTYKPFGPTHSHCSGH